MPSSTFPHTAQPLVRRLVGRATLGLIVTAWSVVAAGAQPAYQITIASPRHGDALKYSSNYYFDGMQEMEVRGSVTGIPLGRERDFTVLVQGTDTPFVALPSGGHSFTTRVWVGPTKQPMPPPSTPYFNNFHDTRHLHLPIVAEVVFDPDEAVVARDRIVIVNTLDAGGIDPKSTARAVDQGRAFQLTASGLDHMEGAHTDTIPLPSLSSFNTDLTNYGHGMRHVATLETRFKKKGKACIPLDDAPELLLTSAWPTILASTTLHYTTYVAAKDAFESGVPLTVPIFGQIAGASLQAYMQAECVHEMPAIDQLEDFEVCVRSMEGTLDTIAIAGVRSVDLEFGKANTMTGDVTLGHTDATVDVILDDLFLRYTGGARNCSLRPEADVAASDLTMTQEMRDWSTCPDLEVDAAEARTFDFAKGKPSPLSFKFAVGSDGETFSTDYSGSGGRFELSGGTVAGEVGTCAGLQPHVDDLLNRSFASIRSSIEGTWKLRSPRIQQSRALDELLTTFESGRFPADDLDFTAGFKVLSSTSPDLSPDYDGLFGVMRTDARLHAPQFMTSGEWVNTSSDIDADEFLRLGGVSFFGTPFDASFMVSTAVFNQWIRERAKSDLLIRPFEPTWAELGLQAPGNAQPTDPAVLNGAVMTRAISPAFSDLRPGSNVRLVMYPTLLPAVYTPVEPPPIPALDFEFGQAPITYQMAHYIVDVLTDDPLGPLAIRLLIDVADMGFTIDPPEDPDVRRLVPAWGDDVEWRFSVLTSNLPSCRLTPSAPHSLRSPMCEFGIAANLGAIIKPSLEQRLLAMVTGVPVPTAFAVPSSTPGPVLHFDLVDRFTTNQQLWYYGNLVRPQ